MKASKLPLVPILIAFVLPPNISMAQEASASPEWFVYGVYNHVNMGNPDEKNEKDFYVSIGRNNGVQVGATLVVKRKAPTYDLLSKKLYRDMTFAIAKLKVIHVESNGAIARLDQMLPTETTPFGSPNAVMIGDLVQLRP